MAVNKSSIGGGDDIIEDIAKRKQTEEILRKRTHYLAKRVKELNCLYGISRVVEEKLSFKETFQGIVDLIPLAW